MAPSEKDLDSAGVITSAVVRVAFDPGSTRSRRKISRHCQLAQGELRHVTDSHARFFREIAKCLYDRDEERLALLHPYLDTFAELTPAVSSYGSVENIPSQDRDALDEFLREHLKEGRLEFQFRRDTGVDQWLSIMRDQLQPFLKRESSATQNVAQSLAQKLLGIAAIAYDVLCGINERYRTGTDRGKHVSNMVPQGMRFIRTALLCVLTREVLSSMDDAAKDAFFQEMERFLNHRINPQYIDLHRSSEDSMRNTIARLERIQSEMGDAIWDSLGYADLPLIVERLSFLEDTMPPNTTETLPWGHVLLVLPDGERHPFFYACDGRIGTSSLTIREEERGADLTNVDLCTMQSTYTIHSSIGCFITGDGSVSPTCSGLLSPRQDEEHHMRSARLRKISSACQGILHHYWQEYPTLFANLAKVDPLIMIVDSGRLHVLCDPSAAQAVESALPERATMKDMESTQTLCESLGLTPSTTFTGFDLLRTLPLRPTFEDAGEAPQETLDRRQVRRELRHILGNSVRGYDWLVKHLSPFGVVEVCEGPRHGVGSHSQLRLGNRFETVSKRIRDETGSLPLYYVFRAIEHLGIEYDIFAASLRKSEGKDRH